MAPRRNKRNTDEDIKTQDVNEDQDDASREGETNADQGIKESTPGGVLPGPDEFGPVVLPHKPSPIGKQEMISAEAATETNEDTRDPYVSEIRPEIEDQEDEG